MKKILLATAAAGFIGLSTLGAQAASATVPTPEPTQFSGNPCHLQPGGPTLNPQFGRDCNPRPIPVPRDCRQIRFVDPRGGPTDGPGRPYPSASAELTAYHGNPNPYPTPTVEPRLRCAPETFVAQLTAIGNTVVQNRVIATGPVFGTGDTDLAAETNTFDRFRLPGFLRAVNVPHSGIAFPSIDTNLCVASVNQLGRWRFAGGPAGSLFRNAVGNGNYLLTGQWVFPRFRNGVCSLSVLPGNPLLQHRINPTYTNVQVWATGLARR